MWQCNVAPFKFHKFHFKLILFSALWANVSALCLGIEKPICLENMEQSDVDEKLEYILSKYEEVDMKIIGTPIGLHGKQIVDDEMEEFHIVFQYIDHTINDIMQTCTFILVRRPGQCETISTVCNTFLLVTPRPLLQREDLSVCEDGDDTATPAGGSDNDDGVEQ